MSTSPPDPTPAPIDRSLRPRSVFAPVFGRRIAWAAPKVSMAVGAAPRLIDNGQPLWTDQTVNVRQVAMNVVVPFCVSSHSAARNEARRAKGG